MGALNGSLSSFTLGVTECSSFCFSSLELGVSRSNLHPQLQARDILHMSPIIISMQEGYILDNWVILLILVHTGNFQFLAVFHKLATNEQGLLPKTSKI